MTPLLWLPIAALVALVPCLPLKQISTVSLEQARDWWILGMLGLATIYLAYAAPPLAPIGLWALVHWRDRHVLETVASWAAIAGFWLACRALPPDAWPWIRLAWCVTGTVAAGTLLWEWYQVGKQPALMLGRPWYDPYRHLHSAGWFGQRTLAGAFFALVLPFYPVWALPIPLLGLFITSSWVAGIAAVGASCVMYPGIIMVILLLGGILLVVAGLLEAWRWAKRMRWSVQNATSFGGLIYRKSRRNTSASGAGVAPGPPDGPRPDGQPKSAGPGLASLIELWSLLNWHRWLEYTPRGDSLDSVWQRLRIIRLLLASLGRPEWWPWGYGTRVGSRNTMEMGVIRWASKHGTDKVPTGHPHVDALHYLYEMGLPGVASLLLLAALVIPKLQWHDPYTACVVAGAILSGGTMMFRYPGTALIWLAAVVHVATR